jgi:hypothetical protein
VDYQPDPTTRRPANHRPPKPRTIAKGVLLAPIALFVLVMLMGYCTAELNAQQNPRLEWGRKAWVFSTRWALGVSGYMRTTGDGAW